MPGIMVISEKSKVKVNLCDEITGRCAVYYTDNQSPAVSKQLSERSPELILIELNRDVLTDTRTLIRLIRDKSVVPIIALVNRDVLTEISTNLTIDDFLINPYDSQELELRITRLLRTNDAREDDAIIHCGNLAVDRNKCEVTLRGKRILLTFKEYELLKFLASHTGRVFSREDLLDKVWGYDYYGGTRTVDVHIRRLRSKTEDSNNTFIETVRNIGYRFK